MRRRGNTLRKAKPIPGQATLFAELPPPPPPSKRRRWTRERGLARSSDPATSKDAAQSFTTSETNMRLLQTLARYPAGLISHELAPLVGIHLVSLSPRLRPLADKGIIHDSGLTRAGVSGRQSIVWKIGPKPGGGVK